MKRLIALLLALSCFLLCGCGADPNETLRQADNCFRAQVPDEEGALALYGQVKNARRNKLEEDTAAILDGLQVLSAAQAGDAQAQGLVGWGYLWGESLAEGYWLPQNIPLGLQYLQQAADGGDPLAAQRLGDVYAWGDVDKSLVDKDKAIAVFRQAAENGSSTALVRLGWFYYDGDGVELDREKAYALFCRAAELGDPEGLCAKGQLLSWGEGVAWDGDAAFDCFQASAEGGDPEGMNLLAQCYYFGTYVTRNRYKALDWFTRAAEGGNASAMFSLAAMYLNGDSVSRDVDQGLDWLRRAAELGDAEACYTLGTYYEWGDYVGIGYPQALTYYQKAADLGSADALYELAWMMHNGKGTTANHARAAELLEQAADLGNFYAMADLGNFYMWGDGVEKNDALAKEWLLRAADAGFGDALYTYGWNYRDEIDPQRLKAWEQKAAAEGNGSLYYGLGLLYAWGRGVEPDKDEAYAMFSRGAELGHAEATDWLGTMYYWPDYNSMGVDYSKALELFRKAADLGSGSAMVHIGLCYLNGQGVPKDRLKGREWYLKAAEAGYTGCYYSLGDLYYETGDYADAAHWYQMGLDAFDSPGDCAYMLGKLYQSGKGVDQDSKKADGYFALAEEYGRVWT